jgi:hypothetical protein
LLKLNGKEWFRLAEVSSDLRRFRDNPEELATAIGTLRSRGMVRPRPERPTNGKLDRPPEPALDVYPDLLNAPGNPENPECLLGEPPAEPFSRGAGIIAHRQHCGMASDREVFEL